MKKYFLFLLVFLLGKTVVAQNILNTPVELTCQNKSIKLIIKQVESNYPVFFSYGKLNLTNKKSIRFQGSLKGLLEKILEGETITYTAIEDQIVLKYTRIKGQPIRGLILDADTQTPMIGANILVKKLGTLVGASTDIDGYFTISNLIVGRYDLEVQYLGYEPFTIDQVLVTSGKEVFLNINLKESILALEEVVVVASLQVDLSEPLNEMATVSARSFSVEETQRYAAAISDPARMAQSFAGVSSGGDDLSNSIIVRGNSARGLLWRLEGVEIPNPNHFADYVSNGGALSILSSKTLANSDFYTGAFPAEFGNALSGVFDLQLRSGNKEKREHSIAFGNLGLEASTEGYFSKTSNASYLANFRYSTLQLISEYLLTEEGTLNSYRDLSFKINVPTKRAGLFSLFGVGGINAGEQTADRDSTKWERDNDQLDVFIRQKIGVVGLTHRYLLSDNSYLKTAIVGSAYRYLDQFQKVIPWANYLPVTFDQTKFIDLTGLASVTYNHKFDARHNIRLGASMEQKHFSYEFLSNEEDSRFDSISVGFDSTLVTYIENEGNTQFLQSFFQWQYRFSKNWELNTGFHFSYLFLNNTFAIDPRAAVKWQFKPEQSLSFAVGLHSKPEHSSTFFIERENDFGVLEQPNRNLEMLKALHWVVGYDRKLTDALRLKLEGYYQYLYNIPVSENSNNSFSILNADNIFSIIFQNDFGRSALVNDGTGTNIGLDITLEKFFSRNYYFLLTSSIFDSKYTTKDGRKFNTRTANNFLFNLLGGKEWLLGRQKRIILGFNGKFTYYSGARNTPIDLTASIAAEEEISIPDSRYAEKLPPYYLLNGSVSLKMNRNNFTHTFFIDVQNITDRKNIYDRYFSSNSLTVEERRQNGFIPFITYRLEISGKEK